MYKVTIGLEVHCEFETISKVFSPSNNSYTDEPNVHIAPQDLGFPGILPVLNKESLWPFGASSSGGITTWDWFSVEASTADDWTSLWDVSSPSIA